MSMSPSVCLSGYKSKPGEERMYGIDGRGLPNCSGTVMGDEVLGLELSRIG